MIKDNIGTHPRREELAPLGRDVEGDAVDVAWQRDRPCEQDDEHGVGKQRGEIHGLRKESYS